MKRQLLLLFCIAFLAVPLHADDSSRTAAPTAAAKTKKKKKNSWLQNLGNTMDSGSPSAGGQSVAGVRGLEEENGNVNTAARDYASVDKLDQVTLSDDEIKRFVKEGGLQ